VPEPVTIGLLWHSGNSDNLGVGALTVAQIAIVESVAADLGVPVRFLTLGWRDPRPSYVTGTNVEIANFRTRDIYRPGGLLASVRRCDLILDIGAGDSFSDIYGGKRFFKYMSAKSVVHVSGRPLALSPQTIGPFKRPLARRAAFASMRRSAAVFSRDQRSIDILRNEGYFGDVTLATDVALRLPYAKPVKPAGPIRVGINLSGLLMNGGYTGANEFGLSTDYPAMMRRIASRFASMDGIEVHLVPHVISEGIPVEDDYRASEALARDLEIPVIVAPRFDSPGAAKTYIAGLDFFMGARMHACIAAFSSGVPVVPMAYSRKFAGLFEALGYPHTVDCTAEADTVIEDKIFAAYERRGALKEEAAEAFGRGLERLKTYEDWLREMISRLASR
jgi:polysaccharide pyruvyl transferase WcaK-like protein